MSNLMSERLAVVGVVNPDAAAAGTQTTGWIDMSVHPQILAIVFAGALGANATIDAKLQQATTAGGAGAKDVPGKAITQLTQAGVDRSNKQAQINLRAEELDMNGGFGFVRLSLTVATATSDAGAVVLASGARYGPPPPAATVVETVL